MATTSHHISRGDTISPAQPHRHTPLSRPVMGVVWKGSLSSHFHPAPILLLCFFSWGFWVKTQRLKRAQTSSYRILEILEILGSYAWCARTCLPLWGVWFNTSPPPHRVLASMCPGNPGLVFNTGAQSECLCWCGIETPRRLALHRRLCLLHRAPVCDPQGRSRPWPPTPPISNYALPRLRASR